ncbi:MAG TPA: class A beta-lactamase [Bryobacteraceae bacterium]
MSSAAAAAETDLVAQWRQIARSTDGTIGAAALHLSSGAHAALNGDDRFPLASVCKLPVAAHILAMVDEGRLRRDQEIEVLSLDIFPWVSEIAKRWPQQKRFPLDEILELMVARSDNTGIETCFRIGGGAPALAARLKQWAVEGIRIDRGEEQIALDAVEAHYPAREQWTSQMFTRLISQATPASRKRGMERYLTDPRDTATPNATVQLLARAFRGELLSKSSTSRLMQILKATVTAPARIKGLLPEGTVVAHKTGTWTTVNGLNGATNDAGVIFLPEGAGLLAVAVYVKGSTRSEAAREQVIARIARAAYDFLVSPRK